MSQYVLVGNPKTQRLTNTMKRHNALYHQVYDKDNIRLAHKNARKGKSKYHEVQLVDKHVEFYVNKIHYMLKNKTFRNAKYHVFKRTFQKKEREIFKLPYFPDRIIQHCILQILEPIWTKSFIKTTYSSIKNRGIHSVLHDIKNAMQDTENTKHCLKMDVKKFYPSIDHVILKQIIRKRIKCNDTLWILDEIIDSTYGVPIGNYLSQFFGNLYLTYFDHWVKEDKQCKYYFRYCDDLIVLHSDKTFLHGLRREIQDYLNNNLKLTLKSSWQVFPMEARGLDFIGYKTFHDHTLLRKSIALQFKRKAQKIKSKNMLSFQKQINGLMSYYGWIVHCNGWTLIKKYITNAVFNETGRICRFLNQKNPVRKMI